jgi:EamA domain-containing membrane protein RarD
VTVFGEEFNPRRLITFLLIWAGLVVFSVDSVRAAQRASAKA